MRLMARVSTPRVVAEIDVVASSGTVSLSRPMKAFRKGRDLSRPYVCIIQRVVRTTSFVHGVHDNNGVLGPSAFFGLEMRHTDIEV